MSTRLARAAVLLLFFSTLLAAQADDAARNTRAERNRQRREEFYRTRAYPLNSIPSGARATALDQLDRMHTAEKNQRAAGSGPVWTLIGPRPSNVLVESSGNGSPYAAGRVTALAVDPRNANVAYAGAASGGVWKTTDGGRNWTPLTDSQPSLSTGSIALAPSNPDIIYVGTGEQNNSGDSYYGAGVLKSIDGGVTWTQLKGPFVGPFSSSRISGGGARIGAIAVHPRNPDIVLAAIDRTPASSAGIYRSIDGGVNWSAVLSGAVGTEVIFQSSDPTIVYAALGSAGTSARNGIYKSIDTGATWTASNGTGATSLPTSVAGRIAFALAPSNPNVIYTGIQNPFSGGLLGLFKSTDAGQTWRALSGPDYCTPQCSYDNIIRVHPLNANIVVAAGLPPWRSLDGGVSWFNMALGADGLVAHTDHHALAFSADGSRLYDGNDGGVSSTSNLSTTPVTWSNLNATLAITEFSSNVSIHPTDPRIAYAGTQDNGTQVYSGNLAWDELVGGDGGSTLIDPAVPSIWYGAFQGTQIYKLSGLTGLTTSLNSPSISTWPILSNGILANDRSLVYPPLAMDPSNPVRVFFGTQRLYRSTDGAGVWSSLSPDLSTGGGSISAIAISPSLPNAIAVGTSNGRLQVTNTSGQVWVNRSTGLPGRSVSQIAFDPANVSTYYVALSGFSGFIANDNAGHVFKTVDFGETYTDISGNLPNIPLNDIVVDPDLPGTLYIASDIGVFASSDDGQSWSTLSTGLPKVLVRALNLHRPSRTLRAVTSGRSMWDLSLPLPSASLAPRVDSASPSTVTGGAESVVVTLAGTNFTSACIARWNGADRPTQFVNATTLRLTVLSADLAKAGRGTVVVFNPNAGAGLSIPFNVPVGPAPGISTGGITAAPNPSAVSSLVPGSIFSLYGTNLAAENVQAGDPPLPYTLGGVTVELNGIPAALYYVSPTLINFQVPWELESFNRATLTVTNGTLVSALLQVNVTLTAPALFTANGSGTGQAAARIFGPEVIPAPAGAFPGSRPVKPGEFIELYGTGLGPVSRLQGDGQPKPVTTAPAVSRTPSITIGDAPAQVTFSGLAPGMVGIYQLNVLVPDAAPPGDRVPVVLSLSGVSSNTVTIAVQSK